MDEISIEIRKNGSIKIPGPIKIVDEEGNETYLDKERVSLCRCGASKNKPFCDGTHRTIGFEGPGATITLIQKRGE